MAKGTTALPTGKKGNIRHIFQEELPNILPFISVLWVYCPQEEKSSYAIWVKPHYGARTSFWTSFSMPACLQERHLRSYVRAFYGAFYIWKDFPWQGVCEDYEGQGNSRNHRFLLHTYLFINHDNYWVHDRLALTAGLTVWAKHSHGLINFCAGCFPITYTSWSAKYINYIYKLYQEHMATLKKCSKHWSLWILFKKEMIKFKG